jgi:hypothetical protein
MFCSSICFILKIIASNGAVKNLLFFILLASSFFIYIFGACSEGTCDQWCQHSTEFDIIPTLPRGYRWNHST